MSKINFTKEHAERLGVLAAEALFTGVRFKGSLGSEMTIYDLFHNCSVNTLSKFHTTLKKEVADIEALDEWSLTDYQQKKATLLKKNQELVNLLIGYQRNRAEVEAEKAKLAELKATYAEMKESTKTPEVKLKELEDQIAKLETVVA